MVRLARVVVPGCPHHLTQRGSRRQETFFCEEDYAAYPSLMAEWCGECGVEVSAYCLIGTHVHLVAVPSTAEGLARGIGGAHGRYTRRINFRQGWRGHLWQEGFSSYVMDEQHLLAVGYVEMNPVRASPCRKPWRYKWSSAAAHVSGRDDALVKVGPMLEMVAERMPDWKAYLALETPEEMMRRLRLHGRTARPLGSDSFIARLQKLLGRRLRPGKPGRPRKGKKIKQYTAPPISFRGRQDRRTQWVKTATI